MPIFRPFSLLLQGGPISPNSPSTTRALLTCTGATSQHRSAYLASSRRSLSKRDPCIRSALRTMSSGTGSLHCLPYCLTRETLVPPLRYRKYASPSCVNDHPRRVQLPSHPLPNPDPRILGTTHPPIFKPSRPPPLYRDLPLQRLPPRRRRPHPSRNLEPHRLRPHRASPPFVPPPTPRSHAPRTACSRRHSRLGARVGNISTRW